MRHPLVRRLVPMLLVVGLLSACRPKSSPEYYKAEADYSVLVSAQGDGAYDDPKMGEILARLQAISPNVREAAEVGNLIAKIQSEQARVARDKADSAKALAAADVPTPPMNQGTGATSPSTPEMAPQNAAAAEPVDAGPPTAPKPSADMPKEEFLKWYGACVTQGDDVQLAAFPKKGAGYEVKDRPDCQQKLGVGPGKNVFVFVEGRLKATINRTEKKTETVVDAGPPPAAPPPEKKDFSVIPGGPIPDELRPPAPAPAEEPRTY